MREQFLYETSVKKQIFETKTEFREENNEKIEVKRQVKSVKPIKISILNPDRKLYKAAEIFYAKTLADYLKAGLLPYSLVAKRYTNDGGPLSDGDKTKLQNLKKRVSDLEKTFFDAMSKNDDESKKQKNDSLLEMNKLNSEINSIENAYSDIFESTAEMKARNDTLEWWALFLIYINENDLNYIPLFGNGSYDERVQKLEEFTDKNDSFYNEVIKKLSYLVSFWFSARNILSKLDFESMEKIYIDNMSNYKVEEENVESIKS